MEDDEDVLFDQAGLISNRVKPFPSLPTSVNQAKVFKTTCLCLAFFGLGLIIALPGPTLLDLQANTNTSTKQITTIFTGRSVGYLVGSMVGGGLFDTINQPCLLSTSLFATASATAVAPYCDKLSSLLFVMGLQGISMGFLDTGGNVMCLHIWGRKSGPYVQTMHFAFGLGAFVAPLLAEPFLSKQENVTTNVTESVTSVPDVKPPPDQRKRRSPLVDPDPMTELNGSNILGNETLSTESPDIVENLITHFKTFSKLMRGLTNIQYAYLTVAIFVMLVALSFVVICCKGPCSWRATQIEQIPDSRFFIRKETTGFRVQILILLFIFYFLYVGMEVTYGGLILTYAVKHLGWHKNKAVLLNALFWGSFAFGRLVAIFLARCVSPPVMLIGDLLLTALAAVGMVLVDQMDIAIWVGTTLLGLGMASIFPTGIVWAEKYMAVTGKATAIFVVGSALGEMLVPLLTAFLYEIKNQSLLYVIMCGVCFNIVIYIIMQNLATNMGDRYQMLRLGAHPSGGDGVDLDMDEIHIAGTNGQVEPGASARNQASWKKRVTFQLDSAKNKAAKLSILKPKGSAKTD